MRSPVSVVLVTLATCATCITSMHAATDFDEAKTAIRLHTHGLMSDLSGKRRPLIRRKPSIAPGGSQFARFLLGEHSECSATTPSTADTSLTISIAALGGDPTGRNDSYAAFAAAVALAVSRNTTEVMADNIRSLGGVAIVLEGGTYLLSQPVVVPPWVGNLRITGGSIVPAEGFPEGRYMLEVGMHKFKCSQKVKQKSCSEDFNLDNLLLDGRHTAYGLVQINSVMGGSVGPDIYFVGFTHAGLTLNGGHEIMVHQAWFGAYWYSDTGKRDLQAGSTSIEVFGNDHVLSDVIVFGSQIGVNVTGGANIIRGVHAWNCATSAGGMGITVSAGSTRLEEVYLDFTSLELVNPKHVSVSNSFFLGMGNIILKATTPASIINGLALTNNMFGNANMPTNETIVLDEREGRFTEVVDFSMAGTMPQVDGSWHAMKYRGVSAIKTVRCQMCSEFVANFSDVLLFPGLPIVAATYSIAMEGEITQHALRPYGVGMTVTVGTAAPVNGTVVISVTQAQSSYNML